MWRGCIDGRDVRRWRGFGRDEETDEDGVGAADADTAQSGQPAEDEQPITGVYNLGRGRKRWEARWQVHGKQNSKYTVNMVSG